MAREQDELEKKAMQVVDQDIAERDIRDYMNERWPNRLKLWEERFIIDLMTSGGYAYESYARAKYYDDDYNKSTAKTGACRTIKRLGISYAELLDYTGHGPDTITGALSAVLEDDPDKYLKHITKLKQLDVKKIEHSGTVELAPTVFTTNIEDLEG